MRATRWMLLAATAAIAASLWLPGEAAEPRPQGIPPERTVGARVAPSDAAAPDESITFEQYRDWRLNQIERRRDELAIQLAATDLADRQKARLEQIKAYYDWLAGLSEAERDRRFRERFDRIDTNHDGTIDATERAAWRDKQRAFRRTGSRQTAAQPQ